MKNNIDIEKKCAYHSLIFSLFYIGFFLLSFVLIKEQIDDKSSLAVKSLDSLVTIVVVGLSILISFSFFIFGIIYGKFISKFNFDIKKVLFSCLLFIPATAITINPYNNSILSFSFSGVFWLMYTYSFIYFNKGYFYPQVNEAIEPEEVQKESL